MSYSVLDGEMHFRSKLEPATDYLLPGDAMPPRHLVDTSDERAGLKTGAGRCVLVVEDDEAVSSLLVELLRDQGYHAVAAFNGKTAIGLARKLKPSLITLDLTLPGADGHVVLERLKADPDTKDIPVVVISAFTQILPAGDRKKLAYLLGKPFDLTEVLEVVQATVGNPYV